MPSPTRRRLLALLAGSLSALGGCSQTDEGTESTPTLTPAPTVSPTERPPQPPADCDPQSYPESTVTTPGLGDGTYPAPPSEVTEASAAAFAEQFESAYRRNAFLADADPDAYERLTVGSTTALNEPFGDGRLVGVEGMLGTTPKTVAPDSTEEPVPYADIVFAAWYYLADSFGRRRPEPDDEVSVPPPSLRSAQVLYCGE